MLLKMRKERNENFRPRFLYHDTCPNNQDFFHLLFGSSLTIRLGLFHFMHRILDSLDTRCDKEYWEALVQLREAVYAYDDNDLAGLIASMKEGTFSNNNSKYSAQQIEALKRSKRWKHVCDPYLRKRIRPGVVIAQNLERWIVAFSGVKDFLGRSLFTNKTLSTAREQMQKCKWVADPDNMVVFKKIVAGPRSKHRLPKWRSSRPESKLEKFHEFLAHLANTGCGPELADALTMGGTADHNVKARWKEEQRKRLENNDEILGTQEYKDEPWFWDHSYLHCLNRTAQRLGFEPPFQSVTTPSRNNGEVFLSEYFKEQQRRNDQAGTDTQQKTCNCAECIYLLGHPPPENEPHHPPPVTAIQEIQIREPDEEKNDAEQENDNEQQQRIEFNAPTLQLAAYGQTRAGVEAYLQPWWGTMPSKCCFQWVPYHCEPKRKYEDAKLRGEGRRGRPPRCARDCPAVIYR
jgi:hypothetical protein